MADSYIIDRIGRRLREASRDVLEEHLPEQWCMLIGRLNTVEQQNHSSRSSQGRQRHSK